MVIKLDKHPRRVMLPAAFTRVRDLFGLGPGHQPFTHLCIHRNGPRAYVMAVAGGLRINVSLGVRFSNRAEARAWAAIYGHAHGLEVSK